MASYAQNRIYHFSLKVLCYGDITLALSPQHVPKAITLAHLTRFMGLNLQTTGTKFAKRELNGKTGSNLQTIGTKFVKKITESTMNQTATRLVHTTQEVIENANLADLRNAIGTFVNKTCIPGTHQKISITKVFELEELQKGMEILNSSSVRISESYICYVTYPFDKRIKWNLERSSSEQQSSHLDLMLLTWQPLVDTDECLVVMVVVVVAVESSNSRAQDSRHAFPRRYHTLLDHTFAVVVVVGIEAVPPSIVVVAWGCIPVVHGKLPLASSERCNNPDFDLDLDLDCVRLDRECVVVVVAVVLLQFATSVDPVYVSGSDPLRFHDHLKLQRLARGDESVVPGLEDLELSARVPAP
ncbi:hypothetical protein LXL04_017276 [Taraxacum kok-saghyz]